MQTLILDSHYRRQQAHKLVDAAPLGAVLTIKPAKRTTDQNAMLWQLLSDISRAKPQGRTHTPEVWKALMMHACGHAVQFEMGLNGQPFPTGFSSSKLTKDQFSDLLEFVLSYAAENGVTLRDEVAA